MARRLQRSGRRLLRADAIRQHFLCNLCNKATLPAVAKNAVDPPIGRCYGTQCPGEHQGCCRKNHCTSAALFRLGGCRRRPASAAKGHTSLSRTKMRTLWAMSVPLPHHLPRSVLVLPPLWGLWAIQRTGILGWLYLQRLGFSIVVAKLP
jgi:hypothetical protein